MALRIDSTRALRTHDQLAHLVEAILTADSSDESRSVEWKSQYADLLSPESSFAIARAVLGMANRPVAIAQVQFEGVGYIVVGAEPGNLRGQLIPDSAMVANSIGRYAGTGWPLWDTRSVRVENQQVFVITVEPPRPGDRIALLQKSYQPARGPEVPEGTIFVRQSGATERAKRRDIELLEERLLAGAVAQAELVRGHDRDRNLRALISDMVHAIQQWAGTMETLVIMTGSAQWQRNSIHDWTNSASAAASGDAMQLAKLNIAKIKLETSDPRLMAPVAVAEQAIEAMSFADLFGSGPSTQDARANAYAHIRAVTTAFADIAATATTLLAD